MNYLAHKTKTLAYANALMLLMKHHESWPITADYSTSLQLVSIRLNEVTVMQRYYINTHK